MATDKKSSAVPESDPWRVVANFALHLRIAHQIAGRVGLELDVAALDEPALRGVHDIQFNRLARFGNPVGALPHTVVLDARRVPCASRSSEIDAAWLDQAMRAGAAARTE